MNRITKKLYVLPSEHGAWIWWIGPLLIGASAARSVTIDLVWLTIALLAAFLFRQPMTVLVKTLSGRRPESDRTPALIWAALYATIALLTYALLLMRGHHALIYLPIPGVPVFLWHLWLVSRRAERGRRGIEIVGAGVLALAAPAAYWVNGGTQDGLAWVLWGLTWLQSAASIVLVYLRLAQRRWEIRGTTSEHVRAGSRTLAYHIFNLALAVFIYTRLQIPLFMVIAFGVMLLDAIEGVLRPAVGMKPVRIGLRQLTVSILFVILSVFGFLR